MGFGKNEIENLPLIDGDLLEAVYDANEHLFISAVAERHQHRYIINLNERGEFSASVYPILPNGNDGDEVWRVDTEEAEFLAYEKVDLYRAESVVEHGASVGLLPPLATGIEAWEDPVMVDPMGTDGWEFRIVPPRTAALLRRSGEAVIELADPEGQCPLLDEWRLLGKVSLWCHNACESAVV